MLETNEPYIADWTNSVTPVDREKLHKEGVCLVRLAFDDPHGIVADMCFNEERVLERAEPGAYRCHINWDSIYEQLVRYFAGKLLGTCCVNYCGTDRPSEFNVRGDYVYFSMQPEDYERAFGIPYSFRTSDLWHTEVQMFRMVPFVHDSLEANRKSLGGLICPDGHEYSRDDIRIEFLMQVLYRLLENGLTDEAIDLVPIQDKNCDCETQEQIDNTCDRVYAGNSQVAESDSQPDNNAN